MGFAIDARFDALDLATKSDVDTKIAALAGQDAAFTSILNNLLKISDAQPGTPEWDEGQNLYTLLTNNYIALADQIATNTASIATLNTWKDGFVASYNTAIAAINTRIDGEITARQAAVADLQTKIDAANAALAQSNTARLDLQAQLKATDDSQTADIEFLKSRITTAEGNFATARTDLNALQSAMDLRVQDITALQAKRDEFETRITTLESKFVGLNADSAFAEFKAGLNGLASPSGVAAPVL
jgi:chromosome segregation ATPase